MLIEIGTPNLDDNASLEMNMVCQYLILEREWGTLFGSEHGQLLVVDIVIYFDTHSSKHIYTRNLIIFQVQEPKREPPIYIKNGGLEDN